MSLVWRWCIGTAAAGFPLQLKRGREEGTGEFFVRIVAIDEERSPGYHSPPKEGEGGGGRKN
jgi:hypothetical protein